MSINDIHITRMNEDKWLFVVSFVTRNPVWMVADINNGSFAMVNNLDTEEIQQLLESARVARVGCIVDGEPYVVPINYEYRNGAIYGHSLPGLKITALRENPRACVQVDKIETDLRWRSALAFGNFEEISDEPQRQEALTRLMKKYPMMTPVEWSVVHDADTQDIIVFRINIDRMTGVAGS